MQNIFTYRWYVKCNYLSKEATHILGRISLQIRTGGLTDRARKKCKDFCKSFQRTKEETLADFLNMTDRKFQLQIHVL